MQEALRHVPPDLLSLRHRAIPGDYPAHIFSPVFPVLTRGSKALADFLDNLGYALTPIPFPVVPRGEERIRVVLHAGNTKEELDEFITRLLQWAALTQQMEADQAAARSPAPAQAGRQPLMLQARL